MGWELSTFDIGCVLFDDDWCGSLLSFVAVSGHVPDDATMTAGASELRFAISEWLSFTLASFAAFSFGSPIVRVFSFLAPFSGSVFIHASPPSSLFARRRKLEVTKFLAVGSGMISIRVKRTFVTLQIGVVLSVFLTCL